MLEFGSETTTPLENGTISDNEFENYTQNVSIVTGFIYLHSPYLNNIKIHHNTFKTAYNHAIYFVGNGRVEISENIFDGAQQGIRVETSYTGGVLKISDNTFKNLTTGVNCTNSNVLISGRDNRFNGVTTVANFSGNTNMILLDNMDVNTPDAKLINSGESVISVRLGVTFKVSNTVATQLTGLDGQGKNQKVTLWFSNGNTILNHSNALFLKAGVNVTSVNRMAKTFIQGVLGEWYEV